MVLDSVSFHFRQDFKDMGARARVLTSMAQDLMALAERRGVAVGAHGGRAALRPHGCIRSCR